MVTHGLDGLDSRGLDSSGLDSSGLDSSGLDSSGLGADGLEASGLAVGGLFRRAAEWRQSVGWTRETVSTGFPSLDRLLPAGGVRRGSLVEWLAGGDAAGGDAGGAISLACAVACRLAAASQQASTIVVVDRGQRFYPPAVMPWIDALAGTTGRTVRRPQLVVARPSRDDDELWAIDQALRCPGVAAVLAWPGRVHSTAMRRWQLASRASGAVGLWVRGLVANPRPGEKPHLGEPTWADAKLAISPVAGDGMAVDLAVRRLRLALAGGPWSGDEMLEERSVELLFDLANGCEATGRHRMPARHAASSAAGRLQPEVVACRAS